MGLCILLGLCILSVLLCFPLLALLSLPVTGISLLGILLSVIGIANKRYNRKLSVICICFFFFCFIQSGIQTAAYANLVSQKYCVNDMRTLYLQIIDTKLGEYLRPLINNDFVIPYTLKKMPTTRSYCRYYYFSILHKKRYFAINQYVAGKRLGDYHASANNIICIYEYDDPKMSALYMAPGEIDKSLLKMHYVVMLDGTIVDPQTIP